MPMFPDIEEAQREKADAWDAVLQHSQEVIEADRDWRRAWRIGQGDEARAADARMDKAIALRDLAMERLWKARASLDHLPMPQD